MKLFLIQLSTSQPLANCGVNRCHLSSPPLLFGQSTCHHKQPLRNGLYRKTQATADCVCAYWMAAPRWPAFVPVSRRLRVCRQEIKRRARRAATFGGLPTLITRTRTIGTTAASERTVQVAGALRRGRGRAILVVRLQHPKAELQQPAVPTSTLSNCVDRPNLTQE